MTDDAEQKPKKRGRKKQNSSISLPHGRKRTISPGFFTDSALLGLSPLHRIFFEGLFCWMDRAGRVLYRPIDLKVRILPMDAFDPVQGLADLEAAGLIRIHEANGLKVISVKPRPWREVQRLHPDEPESALPPHPDDEPEPDDDGNRAAAPISVHGNSAVDPISGAGSSGSSCLRDPRAFVPAGSSGSAGSSPPPPRAAPKLVVVGKKHPLTVEQLSPEQRRWWDVVQRGRTNAGLLAETAVPPDFPAWADRCDVRRLEQERVDHALALYLRDQHFRDRDWPTAVFITPGVFEVRLPKPLAEGAREA
jgi:hypothetical protein